MEIFFVSTQREAEQKAKELLHGECVSRSIEYKYKDNTTEKHLYFQSDSGDMCIAFKINEGIKLYYIAKGNKFAYPYRLLDFRNGKEELIPFLAPILKAGVIVVKPQREITIDEALSDKGKKEVQNFFFNDHHFLRFGTWRGDFENYCLYVLLYSEKYSDLQRAIKEHSKWGLTDVDLDEVEKWVISQYLGVFWDVLQHFIPIKLRDIAEYTGIPYNKLIQVKQCLLKNKS